MIKMPKKQNNVDFIQEMDNEEYFKLPNFGSTTIKTLIKNPFAINNKTAEKACLTQGRAFHAYVLEPKKFKKIMNYKILDVPDFRTKKAQDEKREAIKLGRAPITRTAYSNEISRLKKMVGSILENAKASYMLSDGIAEATFLTDWHGVPVRARIDHLKVEGNTVYCVDLKQISVKSDRPFCLEETRYYAKMHQLRIQAAFYTKIVQLYFGEKMKVRFVHVFVENPSIMDNKSFSLVTHVNEEEIDINAEKIDRALHSYSLGENGASLQDFILSQQRDEMDIVDEESLDIIEL